ncbi:carboxy methyl transferase for protein phosphatase 2A [Mycoemilia scoparia]|uniref:Leucine carboxyl methyltransferase 1 n=1 Tax=Mycoemilia scoparia TaxID=417184 RepID=A0A9W7ZZ14_9FUNG|nr:carboxy methyl transferase for protein phosphatase 2A [Mycoemilia scoparia]
MDISHSPTPSTNEDEAVRSTNNDAAFSRHSAVAAGYLQDQFIKHFVRNSPPKRPPLINRGTYCRLTGVKSILKQFIEKTPQFKETQIVSLGAGYDTTYFVLKSEFGLSATRYFEIDFPEITSTKAMTISRKRPLKSALLQTPNRTLAAPSTADSIKINNSGLDLSSPDYYLISGDLRHFESQIAPKLLENGFKTSVPTLFLSECVLIYLDSEHSNAILDWVTANMKPSGCFAFLTYEQINPSDSFGQMMIQNLRNRGIELKGLVGCPTLESQKQRYVSRGWDHAEVLDLDQYHQKYVSHEEKARLTKVEMLDEWEEFTLLAQHYCFTFAYSAQNPEFREIISDIHF